MRRIFFLLFFLAVIPFAGGCMEICAELRVPLPVNVIAARVGREHDRVEAKAIKAFFKANPSLEFEHAEALSAFLSENFPRDKFVRRLLTEDGSELPPGDLEKTEGVTVSGRMAQMACEMAGYATGMEMDVAFTLYWKLHIVLNPDVIELYAMDSERRYLDFICWVTREISLDEFRSQYPGSRTPLEEGDRVFLFRSSEASWKNLCGRAGYILVRNGRIEKYVVTSLN